MLMKRTMEHRAYVSAMAPFIGELRFREALKARHRNALERVLFIQGRFRKAIAGTTARVEALKIFWTKVQNEILTKARKKRSSVSVQKLAKKLVCVDEDLQHQFLRLYVKACEYKHALAFF